MSETVKSKLFWSAMGALIGTVINSIVGFVSNSLDIHSAPVWISIGLAVLACLLFALDIRERRLVRHKQVIKANEPEAVSDTTQRQEEDQAKKERKWRFFPSNYP